MLLYRLRLHSFVDTFVIVECSVTYSGAAKPLHAHEALRNTFHEIGLKTSFEEYGVVLDNKNRQRYGGCLTSLFAPVVTRALVQGFGTSHKRNQRLAGLSKTLL